MSLYAIGDVQGCYAALQRLLTKLDFVPGKDKLWFVGDLVNRGPQSLETLCFIKGLGEHATCVLGNHDLRLLRVDAGLEAPPKDGTLTPILESPERPALINWLRHMPLFTLDSKQKLAMVHAGLMPTWDLQTTQTFARKIETCLQGDNYIDFLAAMEDMNINYNDGTLNEDQQLHFALNAMVHMRICDQQGRILLGYKKSIKDIPPEYSPWFAWPHRRDPDFTIIVGHWAALGFNQSNNVIGLDTGCVWGRQLTAYRLDAGNQKRFSVECG